MNLTLLSVNVAMPRLIGMQNGEAVISGIAKTTVAVPRIRVNDIHLEGDGQADLINHGGIDKAVYAYPTDNWAWWSKEKSFSCAPGAFGENLTVEGADETSIYIGDRFAWGDCVMEVSQPRAPCFKFNMISERNDAAAIMTFSGRCGWYLRVVKTGEAPTRDCALERISQGSAFSVREVFLAGFDRRIGTERLAALAGIPMLSAAWKLRLRDRLEK
jgi:MOSC domain-containing protein YiiM